MYLRSRLNLMACSEAEIFTTAILLFCLFDSNRRNCVLWDVRLADCLKENTNTLQYVCNVD